MTSSGVMSSTARLYLSKNPAGWIEIIELLMRSTHRVLIVINAEIADGKDTSWLWDVPFERLQGRHAIAAGRRCHDLAVRLLYADVDVVTEPDLDRALALARADDRDVVANYTAFREVRRALGVGTMTRESAVRIAVVLPELLGTYGDGGNGIVLEHRLRWRGIAVERIECADAAAIPETADLYLLGGGEDRPQTLAARELRGERRGQPRARAGCRDPRCVRRISDRRPVVSRCRRDRDRPRVARRHHDGRCRAARGR